MLATTRATAFSTRSTCAARTVSAARVAELDLRVTMPSLTTQQALRGVADPASLDETRRRALDLVGNRNGRLDVGDVVRFRRLLETSVTDASGSP